MYVMLVKLQSIQNKDNNIIIKLDGSAVESYTVVSTLLGMFRRIVLRRTVLRRTVRFPLLDTVLWLVDRSYLLTFDFQCF